MSNVCKVKCGNMEVSIKIQRPSFNNVKEKYEEITKEGADEFVRAYKSQQSPTQNKLNQLTYAMSEARYKKISQVLLNFYNENRSDRYNTCAARVSYALNNSAIPLGAVVNKKDLPRGLWDIGGKYYYLSVDGVINALSVAWNKPKKFDNVIKQSIMYGQSEDFYTSMNSKKENENFFKELQSIQRKGIVAMSLYGNLVRHTTLWNGNNFVDVEMNKDLPKDIKLYLFGYDYLNDIENLYPFVAQFYFWELK